MGMALRNNARQIGFRDITVVTDNPQRAIELLPSRTRMQNTGTMMGSRYRLNVYIGLLFRYRSFLDILPLSIARPNEIETVGQTVINGDDNFDSPRVHVRLEISTNLNLITRYNLRAVLLAYAKKNFETERKMKRDEIWRDRC